MTTSDHTSAPVLRIPPTLSCVCVLIVWNTPKCWCHSCPYPSQPPWQETQTDKQAWSTRRESSIWMIREIRTAGHTLPAPDTANTLQGQPRYHYPLTSLWVLGIQTSSRHKLFGSASSLLWSIMTLSQSYCNCRQVSKSHLQSLATEKKK